ncbi:MAG: lysophospholipid acyltransferase family protein [Gammaproteobacteria bacterium]|nr:lysophospholipid acyltransferase family protein [Gammaproteobacteria bacterium]
MHASRLKPVIPSYIERVKQAPITRIGKWIARFLPYRQRVVLANINRVYGDHLTAADKQHLIVAFYSHLATFIKEMVTLRFLSETKLKQKVTVTGHQHVLDVAASGKGVLLLTAHLGNWEFAPLGAILNFKAFRGHFHFIRRTLTNKTIERILFNRYHKAGLRIIPKKGSLQQVCDVLEQNHAIIFVLDQHAALTNRDGIAVEFFGEKAGTYRSLASIARHTGVPVIPTETYRQADGSHVLAFHAPLECQDYPSSQEALYQNTKRYNEALEQMILRHPEQWMWVHKRWKL